MRQKNMRLAYTGIGLLVLALAFFVGMMAVAPRSTDPAKLMEIVGTVSGVAGGLAIALIAIGLIGKKA